MTDGDEPTGNVGMSGVSDELKALSRGLPCITKSNGTRFAEASSAYLGHLGHPVSCRLKVIGVADAEISLKRLTVTDQMKRSLADLQIATEQGAYGVAILLVIKFTEYQVVEQSYKSTGFDYWLGLKDDAILDFKARLEVSGILTGDRAAIDKRVKQKVRQTDRSDPSGLPAYVAVVEFSGPLVALVRKSLPRPKPTARP